LKIRNQIAGYIAHSLIEVEEEPLEEATAEGAEKGESD
jgi:ribosomal protein S17E